MTLPPCPLQPLPGRVVLADMPMSDATRAGILLPTMARAPGQRALVVAVGEGVDYLAPGDVAAVGRYAGHWEKVGGRRVRVMRADEVLGKFIEEDEAA